MTKASNRQNGIDRPKQTATNVRQLIDMDDISALVRICNTFISICEDHPELVVQYHFGEYTRRTCERVDRGENPTSRVGTQHMIDFYKENAIFLVEDTLLGQVKRTK